ncbi:nodulin-related protein 1-like [Tasmannia lanceolata]|uniref:nodulin-related protein 1-like n=1 Tax=Tasmannia lanceolata TaxID=3420 RepID=UPI0040637E34
MDSNTDNKPIHSHQKHSTTDLFSSAKLLAGAAKSSLGNENQDLDKAKLSSAAANLLEAASEYGKLEEKSFGKYVEKAEDYLHKSGSSNTTTTTTTTTTTSPHPTTTATTQHSSSTYSDSDASDKNNDGGYFKMAEGFMKSSSSSTNSDSDAPSKSNYGEYFKMAEGFLKKN